MLEKIFSHFLEVRLFSTDSRKIEPGAIFFALKGENFNGNLFAAQALESGASMVVVDEDPGFEDPRVVRVPHVLKAMQEVARSYRRTFDIPFLAITGSNGKTTTKELIRDVLSKKYKVHATQGNFNNHIGVPITLLQMPSNTTFAVIEMGANHQLEIAGYCEYAEPDYGLITNIGKAHLEGFGGEEGVKKGKKELYDYVSSQGGKIFVNTELANLAEVSRGMNIIPYGLSTGGQQLELISDDLLVSCRLRLDIGFEQEIRTHLAGTYNLYNIASAVAVGRYFEVDATAIADAIQNYVPDNMRSQVVKTKRNEVILDAYNANPSSMAHALENLAKQKGGPTMFIIGDMRELGDATEREHELVLGLAQKLGLQGICVGPVMHSMANRFGFRSFPEASAAAAYLSAFPPESQIILVKGSRGIRLEVLRELL